jgi:hypothetical protein
VANDIIHKIKDDAPTVLGYVDFKKPDLCEQTKPISCFIGENEIRLVRNNWAQLLVAVTEQMIRVNSAGIRELAKSPLYNMTGRGRPSKAPYLLREKPKKKRNYARLTNNRWIDVNFSAPNLVRIIGFLLSQCGVNLNSVKIAYIDKSSYKHATLPLKPQTESKNFEFDYIAHILTECFPNGFRLESPIELNRFRRFYYDNLKNTCDLSDEQLKQRIASSGILFDGKIYIIDKKTEDKIKTELNVAISSGLKLFFYNEFYEKHREWLSAEGIVSENMLKGVFKKLYPTFSFRTNYFSANSVNGNETAQIEKEIKSIWGDRMLMNYEQVFKRLQYIPFNKIKQTMGQDNDFIWNNRETFTLLDKIEINDDESKAIIHYVESACRTNGYASLSDMPLGDIEKRHDELSLTAIYGSIFKLCLADKYHRNGKIVVRIGETLDALTLMREYCRTLDKCSLKELLDYERELTGECHRWIPMEAGYSEMVRSDKDKFISESQVHFKCEEIDNALDIIVVNEYLPLKSVSTFASLPHCGQAWNLYLLENYCRRFSKRYRFSVLAVNSKNAGVIVRNTCDWSIEEIFADAVARSETSLEKKAVENFLYNQGYIGRRSYAKVNEIIARARVIRKRRT